MYTVNRRSLVEDDEYRALQCKLFKARQVRYMSQLDSTNSNVVILNPLLFWTQNHFPCMSPSVTISFSRTPVISNLFFVSLESSKYNVAEFSCLRPCYKIICLTVSYKTCFLIIIILCSDLYDITGSNLGTCSKCLYFSNVQFQKISILPQQIVISWGMGGSLRQIENI